MAIEIQYARVFSKPVRTTISSNATTPATTRTARTVYSRTAFGSRRRSPAEQVAHRLEREKATDRDHHEEHQLFDREVAGQFPADHIPGVEPPVVARDGDEIPRDEQPDRRDEGDHQPARAAPHTRTERKLEWQRDEDARGQQRQVLGVVGHGPILARAMYGTTSACKTTTGRLRFDAAGDARNRSRRAREALRRHRRRRRPLAHRRRRRGV